MSYTTLHIVPEKGEIRDYQEFQNSHLWARVYWEYLGEKYLHLEPFQLFSQSEKLWPLVNDERLSLDERICLGATYDWVMVKKESLPQIVKSFSAIYHLTGNERWGEMADAIRGLIASSEEFVAVCWTVTSITDAWQVFDAATDDSRPYDISKDNKHWFLFKSGSVTELATAPATE